jgi:hypothetical protein
MIDIEECSVDLLSIHQISLVTDTALSLGSVYDVGENIIHSSGSSRCRISSSVIHRNVSGGRRGTFLFLKLKKFPFLILVSFAQSAGLIHIPGSMTT